VNLKNFVDAAIETCIYLLVLRLQTRRSKDSIEAISTVSYCVHPTRSLKLKIRTTTKHLSRRAAVLNPDKLRCQICHTSVKDNKSLRLEVYGHTQSSTSQILSMDRG